MGTRSKKNAPLGGVPACGDYQGSLGTDIQGMIDGHTQINGVDTYPIPLRLYNISENALLWHTSSSVRHLLMSPASPNVINNVKIKNFATEEFGDYIVELNTTAFNLYNSTSHYNKCNAISEIQKEKVTLLNGRDRRELRGKDVEMWKKLEKQEKDVMETGGLLRKALPSLIIVSTMDMEFAHLDGYYVIGEYAGKPIYRQVNNRGKLFYCKRTSADLNTVELDSDENKGNEKIEARAKRLNIPGELLNGKIALKFQNWDRQIRDTEIAAVSNPLRLLPLFCYDPRRYRYPKNHAGDSNCRPWDEPFSRIVGYKDSADAIHKIWLGFYMHPALGFRPFDEFCEYLPYFYKECMDNNIPILAHCAPDGIITHEANFYKEFDEKHVDARKKKSDDQRIMMMNENLSPDTSSVMSGKYDDNNMATVQNKHEKDYFLEIYGHPDSWQPVLKKFSELRLCFALFGGTSEWAHKDMEYWADNATCTNIPGTLTKDIPVHQILKSQLRSWIGRIINFTRHHTNVYTDISGINISDANTKQHLLDMLNLVNRKSKNNDYGHLKNKIIFGIGWYLTYLMPPDKKTPYTEYCNKYKDLFYEVDPTGKFWERVSLVNPWKFFSLSEEKFRSIYAKLPNLAESMKIKWSEATAKNAEATLKKLDKLNEYVNKILQKDNEEQTIGQGIGESPECKMINLCAMLGCKHYRAIREKVRNAHNEGFVGEVGNLLEKIWEKYESTLFIRSIYAKEAIFKENRQEFGVHINLNAKSHGVEDSEDGRYKAYETIIHELFHNIDYLITKDFKNKNIRVLNEYKQLRDDFAVAIREDARRLYPQLLQDGTYLETNIDNERALRPGGAYHIYTSLNASLIDLVSGGRLKDDEFYTYDVKPKGGHTLRYWQNARNETIAERSYNSLLSSEGFANFASTAIANPKNFKHIIEVLNNSHEIFLNILRQVNTVILR
jgi:hypothetical protein